MRFPTHLNPLFVCLFCLAFVKVQVREPIRLVSRRYDGSGGSWRGCLSQEPARASLVWFSEGSAAVVPSGPAGLDVGGGVWRTQSVTNTCQPVICTYQHVTDTTQPATGTHQHITGTPPPVTSTDKHVTGTDKHVTCPFLSLTQFTLCFQLFIRLIRLIVQPLLRTTV
jgi:hypothetical protein